MVEQLIGKRISIPGQFTGSVTVESVTVVDDTKSGESIGRRCEGNQAGDAVYCWG
jgi:hypothetical protein